MLTLQAVSRRDEADDVVSFVLARPDGGRLPPWTPGAHIDVEIHPGMLRQYSLCGDPTTSTHWRIAVLREQSSRGGSRYLHEHVQPGTKLTVGLPRNNFPLMAASRYVFVAGGIGITPLLPMVQQVATRRANWVLYYGGRELRRMAFRRELSGYGDRVRVLPEDECGLLPLSRIMDDAGQDGLIYCCGPEPLLTAIEQVCADRPPGTLQIERFRPRHLASGPEHGFEVKTSTSGTSVWVPPDQSILEALDRAGVMMPWSCGEGTCGSCETTVLDGEVDHRDSVLSDAERTASRTMMVCVSRARSGELVLDV